MKIGLLVQILLPGVKSILGGGTITPQELLGWGCRLGELGG